VGFPLEALIPPSRHVWTGLTDDQLLAQCEVDTYRASGPGGQKRNKTSSAVRLRHLPSGLIVIAEESRSQHENRAKALRRMRQALFLKVRDDLPSEELTVERLEKLEDYHKARGGDGRLRMARKDPRFWPAVGIVLDVLHALDGRVADAAAALGVSTGNLISFLETDPKVWGEVNILRTRFGQKPLHT
jgi:hypothetical protein